MLRQCVLSQSCDNVVDRCVRYQRRLVQSAHPWGGGSTIGYTLSQPASQHGESGLKRLWGGLDMWLCNVGNADGSTADAPVELRNVGNAIGSAADATVQLRNVGEAGGCTTDATQPPTCVGSLPHMHRLGGWRQSLLPTTQPQEALTHFKRHAFFVDPDCGKPQRRRRMCWHIYVDPNCGTHNRRRHMWFCVFLKIRCHSFCEPMVCKLRRPWVSCDFVWFLKSFCAILFVSLLVCKLSRQRVSCTQNFRVLSE